MIAKALKFDLWQIKVAHSMYVMSEAIREQQKSFSYVCEEDEWTFDVFYSLSNDVGCALQLAIIYLLSWFALNIIPPNTHLLTKKYQ